MSNCEEAFRWLSRLKRTYQPVEGFEDKISKERAESFTRIIDTIIDHCGSVEGKTFLDIGSNLGYFCLKLAELGAVTTGIEKHRRRVEACKCLAKSDKARFISDDAVEWVLSTREQFDYVLLLNVFHHILVKDELRGWRMFNKLIEASNGMFVMMRNSLKDWSLCEKREEIPHAVIQKSDAESYVEYPPVNGRVIYVFS